MRKIAILSSQSLHIITRDHPPHPCILLMQQERAPSPIPPKRQVCLSNPHSSLQSATNAFSHSSSKGLLPTDTVPISPHNRAALRSTPGPALCRARAFGKSRMSRTRVITPSSHAPLFAWLASQRNLAGTRSATFLRSRDGARSWLASVQLKESLKARRLRIRPLL